MGTLVKEVSYTGGDKSKERMCRGVGDRKETSCARMRKPSSWRRWGHGEGCLSEYRRAF